MKISVFTPSHQSGGLERLYRSLQQQTHEDWEWIILGNGPEAQRDVELQARAITFGDRRVRVYVTATTGNIGALKYEACHQCSGELFVEVDHDDWILPSCLERLASRYEAFGSKKAFLYSETVTTRPDGTSIPFLPSFGWTSRPWNDPSTGKTLLINENFEITARSLCEILFSPDHVRCWSRDAYWAAGGHDPKLSVGDDHELIVRTYLAGVPFLGIDQVLYVHCLREDSASKIRLDAITQQSWATRDKFLHALVVEWSRRQSLTRYDLGGAHNCPKEFIPVDQALPDGLVGVKADVFNFLAAQPDSSIGVIRACDFLEHVPSTEMPALLNLVWKKLVPGGWLLSATPAVSGPNGEVGRGAFQDPTHVSFWTPNNFWYYTDRNYSRYVPGIQCRFQAVRNFVAYPSAWHEENHIPYVYADLCALKGQRQPGLCLI